MRRSTALLAAACLLVWAASASARNDDFDRTGFTVGLAGTYAFDMFEGDLEDALADEVTGPTRVDVDGGWGLNASVGYRFHRYVSAEAEVEWISSFDTKLSASGLGGSARVDVEPVVVTANAKGYPLTGRFQPFVLAGLGVMTVEVSESDSVRLTDFAMRFGGGIDIYLDDTFAVSIGADYVLPFGEVKDLDYVSLKWGIEYRFP